MNCALFRSYADRFVDGELDCSENQEVAEHLDLCAKCASHVEGIRRLKNALARTLDAGPTPQHLRDRILATLHTDSTATPPITAKLPATKRRVARNRFAVPLALAAALALFAAVGQMRPWAEPSHSHMTVSTAQIVEDVRAQHRACVAGRGAQHHDASLSRDLTTIANLLSQELELAVIAPDLARDGFELMGADRCGIAGRPGAHILYRSPSTGGTLSVYTVARMPEIEPNTPSQATNREYFTTADADLTVVAWHQAAQTYVTCGDVEPTQMVGMLEHVQVALQQTSPTFVLAMLDIDRN